MKVVSFFAGCGGLDLGFEQAKYDIMAILTVYTELLDNTLSGARIIDMGTQRSCACFHAS